MNRRACLELGIFLACCPCALALNPCLDVDQYAHNAWTIREAFFKGTIKSIAQTPDGYLWLGTEFGLLRFDGVRMTPWQPPSKDHLPNGYIRSLLTSRDGLLWIGTDSGLASWKAGKLTQYPALAGLEVDTMLEDRQGTIWVGGAAIPRARLCSIQGSRPECHGDDGRLGARVASLYQDGGGNLWVGADNGLWRWAPGAPKLYPTPDRVLAITEAGNGELLVGMRAGIQRLAGGSLQPYQLPNSGLLDNMLRDRDGGLWIVKQQGLFHVHRGKVDEFAQSDGLSGDNVSALFEDREGNIWVATNNGLDRFRELAVVTMSAKQGFLDTSHTASVLADRDGSIWVATLDRLNRWKDGLSTVYRRNPKHRLEAGGNGGPVREIADVGLADEIAGSLFQDRRGRIWISTAGGVAYFENDHFVPLSGVPGLSVHSIAEDSAGDIWISHDQGLIHLRGSVVERIPLATLGRRDFAFSLFSDPVKRCLWLGFFHGGVTCFKDDSFGASFSNTEGLAEGRVNSLQVDKGGAVWAATEGGLSRLKDGRVATLTGRNGLPCDNVDWVMEDDAGAFWLNMACGVVRIARTELDSWAAGSKRTVQVMVFDSSDGVRSHAFYGNTSPRVTKSLDGRLWFSTWDGLSVIDPRHLPFNNLPPPVHIERITANGKNHSADSNLHMPSRVRDLEIDYTALTFVAPEKVRFRYKLESQDPDWKEAVNSRQARYSNLPPGAYRFRVIAANNSGVWNETGDTLEFSIAPAWNQTTWFYAGCVAVFLATFWGLYRLRIYQISRELNAQLEGRVDERLQVARELHDTLLQSFHGLLPRFQAVYNLLPGRVDDAKQVLESALEDAGKAITEARDAVQGMRSSTVVTNDLPKALELFGQELAAQHTSGDAATNGNRPSFSAEVEGAPQDLQPILRDEIYRIAAEALRNAFHHAAARQIEVEIRYGPRDFRVRVRDDGAGIDPAILRQEGRAGHFGIKGMRERAEHIGGKLEVWSERGAGTEIELTIPAFVAYGRKGGRRSRVS